MSNNEYFDQDGIIELNNIILQTNNIGTSDSSDYLINLIILDDNTCINEAKSTDIFNDGCINVVDSVISMSNSNFTNNNGSFIISISRSNESTPIINSTNICLNNIAVNNDNDNDKDKKSNIEK